MIKRFGLIFGMVGLFVTSPALADRDTAHYTSITVFGDSLVDAGNYYAATGGINPAPQLPYPDPALGYFQGRLTNGYNYPDLLSQDLFGKPTTPALAPGGTNFAFAGARIVDTGDPIPDLGAQLGLWQLSGQAVDKNGLYILNFGANDVYGAKGVFGDPPLTGAAASAYLLSAAQQYAAGVQFLIGSGVRNILMTDFPLAGDAFTVEANQYLSDALAGLILQPDTDLMVYSLSGFNVRVLTDPGAFGLPAWKSSQSCIEAGMNLTDCSGYFSFDGVHPTAAVQAAGYRDLNQQFGLTAAAVPEPATWAMMLIGFAMIGAAMRHRRRSPIAPSLALRPARS